MADENIWLKALQKAKEREEAYKNAAAQAKQDGTVTPTTASSLTDALKALQEKAKEEKNASYGIDEQDYQDQLLKLGATEALWGTDKDSSLMHGTHGPNGDMTRNQFLKWYGNGSGEGYKQWVAENFGEKFAERYFDEGVNAIENFASSQLPSDLNEGISSIVYDPYGYGNNWTSKHNEAQADQWNSLVDLAGSYLQGKKEAEGIKNDAGTAAEVASNEAQQAAAKGYQNAISAGINKTKAGMLGDTASQITTQTTNTAPMQNALAGQRASTQADYLQAMGQVQGAENEASNLQKGAVSAGISGALTGAGTGAMMGAGFMSSDETTKTPSKLPEADVEDALRKIESVEYRYKPEYDDGSNSEGPSVGVTAQSLEGTAFDDVVSTNPQTGKKQLDKKLLLEAVMSGIAALQKEIDELKEAKNG